MEGVRILELVHMPPGELCTMILGDMGAEVIKVEAFTPNDTRSGPHDAEALKTLQAFNALNRNKKSIRLNLKSEQGKEVFYRLAGNADVIVEGFRPGVVKRMGVDYEMVSKLNPRIIYCSLSGYGQDGPYSQYPGHDIQLYIHCRCAQPDRLARGAAGHPAELAGDFAGRFHARCGRHTDSPLRPGEDGQRSVYRHLLHRQRYHPDDLLPAAAFRRRLRFPSRRMGTGRRLSVL